MPYIPGHDEVTDPAVLAPFMARHPLAALVTHDGLTPQVDMIPLLLVDAPDDERATTGKALIGHVARANPLWREELHRGETLATFGPAEHYISPTWYPSKAEHHRTVPTWNYLVAHAWGPLDVHDDPKWVRAAVARLTTAMEARQPEPWRMGQAPSDYLDEMLANIVGIRIPVRRMVGRFKVSAQRTDAERLGARDGVLRQAEGRAASEVAAAMTDPPQHPVR